MIQDLDSERSATESKPGKPAPSDQQLKWLSRGLGQPGGKLPLFDDEGQKISGRTVKSCIEKGWAEPWFDNPIKPDWHICKLTEAGHNLLTGT
ncbi:MAG: hypothetical protein HQ512_08805 [Rhodospirillales bacterium]|nr:hypothetical protein [Rhodospirillales bacterium]